MIPKTMLSLIALAIIGCQVGRTDPQASPKAHLDSQAPNPDYTVYQTVLTHLSQQPSPDPNFTGAKIQVVPGFCEGDSLFYSWNKNDVPIDSELEQALRNANTKINQFNESEFSLPTVKFGEAKSFIDLDYYGSDKSPVDARCLVKFWQAGISKDGNKAVVRFFYGPTPHGAAGTYLLKRTDTGWQITASTISYYV